MVLLGQGWDKVTSVWFEFLRKTNVVGFLPRVDGCLDLQDFARQMVTKLKQVQVRI